MPGRSKAHHPPADAAPLDVFVALLRGINVGGNNRVPMAQLRAALTERGLADVRTYIASGNVVFAATDGPDARERWAGLVTSTVLDEFDVTCSVLVRTGDEIQAIAAALPEDWIGDEGLRVEVLYLFDDIDEPGILERLPLRPVDQVHYTPGAVLWAIERGQQTKSGLARIIGGPLYRSITVRNVRTARTLAGLVDEDRALER